VKPRRAAPTVLKQHLLRVADALSELQLPYMIIGAFALSAWGRPRATLDLDLIIQAPEIPDAVVRSLYARGFRPDKQWEKYNPNIRAFHKRFRSGRTALDILLKRDAHDAAAFLRRKKKRFDGRYLWFPSAEDLLIQKLRVGRPQDFIDATGIIDRMRGKLDRRYLIKWARKLGLVPELAHVWPRK
jgi:hypothetical protein